MATHSNYTRRRSTEKIQNSLLYLVLLLLTVALSVAVYRGGVRLVELQSPRIQLSDLPVALTLSMLRLLGTYIAGLIFAFAVGILAARTWLGERIIIPALDIGQSIPIVGFFPAAVALFIQFGNGHRLSIEFAAMFLIFTSMVWNLAFSIYESIKSIPQDSLDAVASLGLRGSQRFWRLYVPAAIPRLVYNSVMSWSNGWFFLVASEIIAVGPIHYDLPGIGSFLARAAEQNEISLVLWGLGALTFTVLLFDLFLWRPLETWSRRFRQEQTPSDDQDSMPFGSLPQSLFSKISPYTRPLFIKSRRFLRILFFPPYWILREILLPLIWDLPAALFQAVETTWSRHRSNRPFFSPHWMARIEIGILIAIGLGVAGVLSYWLAPPWPPIAAEIPGAILASTARIALALAISLLWILPLTLFTWNRPKLRALLSTVAQIGASLPAIALFPLILLIIVKRFGGGMEVASLLLLLMGMQWYLLFNALAGAAGIPNDFSETVRSFGLSSRQTWKKLVIPAIRPALFTGFITAWGGGWNALVVSEYVATQGNVLQVKGLGALLSRSVYETGDPQAIGLCVAAMVGWILLVNVVIWRPIYRFTIERYKIET